MAKNKVVNPYKVLHEYYNKTTKESKVILNERVNSTLQSLLQKPVMLIYLENKLPIPKCHYKGQKLRHLNRSYKIYWFSVNNF